MENILYVIIRGFAIGVLISAPMGPIGMLVIQRTLNKGRWPAFATGIGAAISDVFYCVLTGTGLSFITLFVQEQQVMLQVLGSMVLAIFGVVLFRKNPSRTLSKPKTSHANTYWKDVITGFLFTVSNPLILFFIIGLFARFNIFLPEFEFYHYFAGYLSIAGGALAWWFMITFLVNKMRTHFNVRSLYLINRIIGSLLILFALVGVLTGISDSMHKEF